MLLSHPSTPELGSRHAQSARGVRERPVAPASTHGHLLRGKFVAPLSALGDPVTANQLFHTAREGGV